MKRKHDKRCNPGDGVCRCEPLLCYGIHFPQEDIVLTNLLGGPWVCWQEWIADDMAAQMQAQYPNREIAIMQWEEPFPEEIL